MVFWSLLYLMVQKNQSYFLVMDAATFTEIDRSYLPHNIPWVAHGMHFPEAKWTLSNELKSMVF